MDDDGEESYHEGLNLNANMVIWLCWDLYNLIEKHTELVKDNTPRTYQEQLEHLDRIDKIAEEIQKTKKQVDALLPHLK